MPWSSCPATSHTTAMNSCVGLIYLLLVAAFVTADDDEDSPQCIGEMKRLMEQRFRPSHLSYEEPDILTVKATFSMGCFWGVESVFGALPGVVRVKAGYTGGTKQNPTYKSLGDHTESVEIEFDPLRITYASLLDTFWANHNPLDLKPVQYMSAIFYHDYSQMKLAEDSKLNRRRASGTDALTKIKRAEVFYDAEDYHQKYFLRQHANFVQSLGLTDRDFLSSWRATRLLGYITGNGDEKELKRETDALCLTDDHVVYLATVRKSRREGTCSSAKRDEL